MVAEGSQVGSLNGADVTFRRDGVVGKGIPLLKKNRSVHGEVVRDYVYSKRKRKSMLTHEPKLGNSLV